MDKAITIALSSLIAVGLSAPVAAHNWFDQLAVKAAATYTKPTNNGLDFGFLRTGNFSYRPFFVEPSHEFDFAWGLEFRTNHDGDTRAFLEYDHYNHSKQRAASGLILLGSGPEADSTVTGDVSHDEHSIKFGARHTLHFGPYFDTVLGGFFEYANVEKTWKRAYAAPGGAIQVFDFSEDQMRGWGPGIDALGRAFPFGNENHNWSLFAAGSFSLLWADHEYHYASSPNQQEEQDALALDPEDTKSRVSKMETSLGVEYSRLFTSDVASVVLGARLGVKYLGYFNAFKGGNHDSVVSGAVQFSRDYDYGRMGPFLEFRLGGAHS